MIDFRYHLVSLIAVFLALGIGVIMGTAVIDRAVVDRLERQQSTLNDDINDVQAENERLRTSLSEERDASSQLADEGGQRLLPGAVPSRDDTGRGQLLVGALAADADGDGATGAGFAEQLEQHHVLLQCLEQRPDGGVEPLAEAGQVGGAADRDTLVGAVVGHRLDERGDDRTGRRTPLEGHQVGDPREPGRGLGDGLAGGGPVDAGAQVGERLLVEPDGQLDQPLLDATEYTISSIDASGGKDGFRGGDSFRPSINAYMYANARAIASRCF